MSELMKRLKELQGQNVFVSTTGDVEFCKELIDFEVYQIKHYNGDKYITLGERLEENGFLDIKEEEIFNYEQSDGVFDNNIYITLLSGLEIMLEAE